MRNIVIIDDIDRLAPSEMRLIFSLVKSLGDLPNVVYLLSFDRAVVTRSLAAGEDGVSADFLEKIGRDLAVLADGVLAWIAPVTGRPILHQEDLAAGGRDLETEALQLGVPPDDLLGAGGQGIDSALGEFKAVHAATCVGYPAWL